MGQYRFSVYLHWQIGLLVNINRYSIDVYLPFITAHIATSRDARGNNIVYGVREFIKQLKQ